MFNFIIPTYNEKKNVLILLKMISQYMTEQKRTFKIIVVDDGSPDGTYKEVVRLNNPNVLPLQREGKLGLGTAYKFALEHCTHPFTFIMDADLSHDPIYLNEMIKIQEDKNADIVSGTRYTSGGVYGWSFIRKLISRGANNGASLFLNLECSDLTGSYRLYKTDVLRRLLSESFSDGYSIQMELICRAESENLKIYEQPIIFYERDKGVSKLDKYEFLRFISVVLKLFIYV